MAGAADSSGRGRQPLQPVLDARDVNFGASRHLRIGTTFPPRLRTGSPIAGTIRPPMCSEARNNGSVSRCETPSLARIVGIFVGISTLHIGVTL
jgi:hypothetical protein